MHGTTATIRPRHASWNFAAITKFLLVTKINNFANLERFTKFLCLENLELYGMWFVLSSATQNRMHSFLHGYQATVALTSSFFLPVCRRQAYPKCTTLLLKRMLMPTLLHTLCSVVCGELSYHRSSLWSWWPTYVGHAIGTVQQFFGQRTARRRANPAPSGKLRSTCTSSRLRAASTSPPAMHAARV